MKIASQTNLRKDVSFHLTKLPYLPSKATINSTIKIDKAITKRFKTEPKKIINEPQLQKKSLSKKKISQSHKVLPTINNKSYQNQDPFSYHRKVVRVLDKHRPDNGSKSIVYDMKTQGQKSYYKSRKKLQPQDSLLFQDDELEKSKRFRTEQIQQMQAQNPQKYFQARRNFQKMQFLDKIVNIRTLSKNLKQKSDKLHKKFEQINEYTNEQYEKLCKKNTSTKRYVDKKISNSSVQYTQSQN